MKYNASPRLIYVGEWHTHPDGPANPSRTDMNAMAELADDKNVLITNPVLMILEIGKKDYKMEFYLLYYNKLLRYGLSDEKKETSIWKDRIDLPENNEIN